MPTTLITIIGRGRKDETGQTYSRVTYAFGPERHASVFFVDAVLASGHGRDVDEVVVCGTRTSSWAALVNSLAEEEVELYTNLDNATETTGPQGRGADDALLERLSAVLSRAWRRRVRCVAVAQETIDDENIGQVVDFFLRLLPWRDSSRSLLLDTTHGFRTLSLAASVAVELADALAPGFSRRTRLMYGELKGSAARGIAFDSITATASVADAISLFLQNFDGEALAAALQPHAPRLAAAVGEFSDVVLTNSLRRLDESARRLLNASEEIITSTAPGWVVSVRDEVHRIAQRLGRDAGPGQLLALADLRAERGHTALAVLALWEAITWLACGGRVATYEEQIEACDALREELRRHGGFSEYEHVRRLRNQVAHGAALAENTMALQPRGLREGFERARAFVARLIVERAASMKP